MDLRPLEPRQLESWRKQYRAQLRHGVIPDFHEALCRLGQAYGIEEAGRPVGYVILTTEAIMHERTPVIPEFFLQLEAAKDARSLLAGLVAKLNPQTIMGRTDDAFGFPLLMDLRMANQISSPLYRIAVPPSWVEVPRWAIVASDPADASRLLDVYASAPPEDGGIGDESSLARSLAAWRHYRLMVDGQIAAVAYVAPQGQGLVTVQTLVPVHSRGRGYGRYLAAFAIRRELAQGSLLYATVDPENGPGRGLAESLGASLAAYFVNFSPAGRPDGSVPA